MKKRIRLQDRTLPTYSLAEELVNAISHGIGILLGIIVLILCAKKSNGNSVFLTGSVIYGISMIILYAISTLYHSFVPGTTKKVFQILDHCTIYILIAGTYTPIFLIGILPAKPILAWAMLLFQWGISALAITLNAIDLKNYRPFSYTAYIVLGWAILFVWPIAAPIIGYHGMLYLLLGGISYTIGAILFAIGSKRPWFHSIFHFFVVLGSFLQFLAVYRYIL